MHARLTFFLTIWSGVASYYIPVADNVAVYPLVVSASSGQVLQWATGAVAEMRARSSMLRVSDRGVRFISKANGAGLIRSHDLWQRHASECEAVQDALCVTPNGTAFFPQLASGALVPMQATDAADDFTRFIAGFECKRNSNRVVGAQSAYGVSLCDITQKGLDFVYSTGRIHVRKREETMLFYVVVSLSSVVLVTCLAQAVASMLAGSGSVPNPQLSLVSCLVLLLASFLPPFTLASYVTDSDSVYHWFTVSHTIIGVCVWSLRIYYTDAGVVIGMPFGVIVAALMAALCRMYDGAECQYLMPLMFLMLLRAMYRAVGMSAMVFSRPRDVSHAHSRRRQAVASHELDAGHTVVDEEVRSVRCFEQSNPLVAAVCQSTLVLEFAAVAMAYQYGFKPLFYERYTADAYMAVMVLFASGVAEAIAGLSYQSPTICS